MPGEACGGGCYHPQSTFFLLKDIDHSTEVKARTLVGTQQVHCVCNTGVLGFIEVQDNSCFCRYCHDGDGDACEDQCLVMPWVRCNIYSAMQTEKKDFVNVYFREGDVIKGRQMKESKVALGKRKAAAKKMSEATGPSDTTTSSATKQAAGKKTADTSTTKHTKKKGTAKGKPPRGASQRSSRRAKKVTPVTVEVEVVVEEEVPQGKEEEVPAVIKFPGRTEVLWRLKECDNLSDMMVFATEVLPQMYDLSPPRQHATGCHSLDIEDDVSLLVMPIPAQNCRVYTPVFTTGDGNCFYNALSRFLYGHEMRSLEMHTRCTVEAVLNMPWYTDPDSLMDGTNLDGPRCHQFIAKASGHVPQEMVMLDEDAYMAAFVDEIQRICMVGHDVGLWSFAIACNVIGHHIFSWMPFLDEELQEQFNMTHQVFWPANKDIHSLPPVCIMWTCWTLDALSYQHFVSVVT